MNFRKYNENGKPKKQKIGQLVDITLWAGNEEVEPYEEGAREKNRIRCPATSPFPFLIPNHNYLFKQSNPRYPAQFWVEIAAYRLGCVMGVPVPPAFVGIDTRRGIPGAVIEWFYNYPGEPREEYIPGGDLFQKRIPDYERKKGKQHNLADLVEIVKERGLGRNWQEEWAKIFCFDALIGNTDRHQDNWGIVHYGGADYFSPAFDNGTAMGHEIIEKKLLAKCNAVEKYVLAPRAAHHIKWNQSDNDKMKHIDFLRRLMKQYPNMIPPIHQCMRFSIDSFGQEVFELMDLSNALPFPYVKLTPERADFIIKLIEYRYKKILEIL